MVGCACCKDKGDGCEYCKGLEAGKDYFWPEPKPQKRPRAVEPKPAE